MDKSPEAFRTISEVADTLDVPPHVLRFWETRFTQVKPVKRGGGRRYYRPEDVRLLRGIRGLLYDDGMTIKGVQKILRERGIRHVIGLGTLENGEAAAELVPAGDMSATVSAETLAAAFVEPAVLSDLALSSARPIAQADLFETAALLVEEAPARADPPPPPPKPLDKVALASLLAELQVLRDIMTSDPAP